MDSDGIGVRWICAFLDRPQADAAAAAEFWCAVTGTRLSARRGERGQWATLLPARGDAALKIQAVLDDGQGGHLDLEVDTPTAARDTALALGACLVADQGTLQVLRSPAGLFFCLVPPRSGGERPPVADTPGGRVRADQVALDIAPAAYDREVDFWARLTGWRVVASVLPEFTLVLPPEGMPLRLLLQRLAEPAPARVHLDLACADVAAATAYHRSLGAQVVAEHEFWTVLRDPGGGSYCLTARDPDTGRLEHA